MWKRSRVILLTYATRWGVWGMGLLFLAICAGHSRFGDDPIFRDGDSSWWNSPQEINSVDDIQAAVSRGPNEPLRLEFGLLAGTLQRDSTDEALAGDAGRNALESRVMELLSPLKQIVELDCISWDIREETLRRIAAIPTLRKISLWHSPEQQPLELSPLATLPELETLELRSLGPSGTSLSPLAGCPKLRVLRLGDADMVVRERLREIAAIPSLRVLELPRLQGFIQSQQALDELRTARNLREVRLEVSWDNSLELAEIQSRIPLLPVRARLYSEQRVQAFSMLGLLGFGMLSALMTIPVSQFSLPLAELAPGFKRSHRQVTWALLTAVLLCVLVTVIAWGGHFFPTLAALAGSLLLITSFMASGGIQVQMNGWEAARRFLPVVVIIGACMLCTTQPLLLDSYLMGRQNGWAFLASCGAIWFGWRMTRSLGTLCRDGQESGLPPLCDLNAWQSTMWKVQDMRERQSAAAGRTKERKYGDPMHSMAVTMAILGWPALALVCADRAGLLGKWSSGEFPQIAWKGVLLEFAVMGAMFIYSKWWSQAPFLAGQFTRPPLRRDHLNKLFLDVGRDCLRLLPILLASSLHFYGDRELSLGTGSVTWLVPISLTAAGAACCWAGTLWLLPVRSKIAIVLLAFCFIAVVGGAFMGIAYSMTRSPHGNLSAAQLEPAVLAAAAGIVTILALAATLAARAYYARIEWGKIH